MNKIPTIVSSLIFLLSGSVIIFVWSIIKMRAVQRAETKRQMREKTEALEKALREKEKEAAETLLEQSFNELRKSILEELEHLDKQRQDGKLSEEEEEHRDHLLHELRQIQDMIDKKIKEIA